jgi:hypothetical protein
VVPSKQCNKAHLSGIDSWMAYYYYPCYLDLDHGLIVIVVGSTAAETSQVTTNIDRAEQTCLVKIEIEKITSDRGLALTFRSRVE